MNRRKFLQYIISLPLVGNAQDGPIPVPPKEFLGVMLSWHTNPVGWSVDLEKKCLDWCYVLAEKGMKLEDGRYRHDPTANECIAANQPTWAQAFIDWTNSPTHLYILQEPRFCFYAMAGLRQGTRTFWVLRATETL